ncbi:MULTISPECIES: ABC transporter permease [Cupriavidus]|uniref:ABC transporter permease n=1 Tax=Cupriavidus TaxID=106589 RepID=UPI00037C9560|nr:MULTISPECIES: ABC transporter permease [Cupriavidus]
MSTTASNSPPSDIAEAPAKARPSAGLATQRLALALLLLAGWWVASLKAPAYVFPSPQRTLDAMRTMIDNGSFFTDIRMTFGRVVSGFLMAVVVGVPLGIVLGANKRLADFFEPILAVVNTVSSAIWAIFALIWFGISNMTTIFVVFMTAMPLILTNVWQGTRTVNADFVELARAFRMSGRQVLWKVYLPTVLPHFFAGARLAFGFGWRVSLVAETIGSTSGIGYRLRQAADLVLTDQVFAWTFTLVAMMLVIELGLLKPLERHLFRWKKDV